MALPENSTQSTMADAVEVALADLDTQLRPADLAVVTQVRMAARAIDTLMGEGKTTSAMNYMYLVTAGMDKLGGSVESRQKLGTKEPKQRSKLAIVRGIHGGEDGPAEPESKPGKRKRKDAAG